MPGLLESPNSVALCEPSPSFHLMSFPNTSGIWPGSGKGMVVVGPWERSCCWVSAEAGIASSPNNATTARRCIESLPLARGAAVLAVLVHALGDVGADARQDQHRRLLFARARAVPMDALQLVDRHRAGMDRIGQALVIDAAGGRPPGAGEHIGPAHIV